MSDFLPAWLRLREPADAASRDGDLARRFAAALPRPVRLVDLGAGTGANARALAPVIAGDQAWLLVERDASLRAKSRAAFLAWARRGGHSARAEKAAVVVAAGGQSWRFATLALDLAQSLPSLAAADGVACSAFLDLASPAWLERLALWLAARPLPFLAILTVDGRRLWSPPAPEDALIAAAFRRHQGGDKGLGRAAGADAAGVLARQLEASGFAVTTGPSDWHLGPGDHALLAAIVRTETAAAREADPGAAAAIAAWRERRIAEAAAGTLALTVGHCDLLALPQ
jgi:hypothetical protein